MSYYNTEKAFMAKITDFCESDVWREEDVKSAHMIYVEPGEDIPCDVEIATPEQIDAFKKLGGFVLTDVRGKNYLIEEAALWTIRQRFEISGRGISKLLEKRSYDSFCTIVNTLLSDQEKWKILVRYGVVIAAHSKKYCCINQEAAFNKAKEIIEAEFPDGYFVSGEYTTDVTEALYILEGSDGDILKAYKNAWLAAGLATDILDKASVAVSIQIGDTGKQALEAIPYLLISRDRYPLSFPVKVKHNKGASEEDLKKTLPMAFAAAKSGANDIAKLVELQINHPCETFVRACKEVGLTQLTKRALTILLEEFATEKVYIPDTTGFEIYEKICEIEKTASFKKLTPKSKMKVIEALYRLLKLDWESLDTLGPKEF